VGHLKYILPLKNSEEIMKVSVEEATGMVGKYASKS